MVLGGEWHAATTIIGWAGPAWPDVVMLLGALDQTIMAPALPAVAGDLGGLDRMPAIVDGVPGRGHRRHAALREAGRPVRPQAGAAGRDRGLRGRRRDLCARPASISALLVWRVVQGAGGGGLMIGAQAVLGEIVSPRERGRYLGLLGAVTWSPRSAGR